MLSCASQKGIVLEFKVTEDDENCSDNCQVSWDEDSQSGWKSGTINIESKCLHNCNLTIDRQNVITMENKCKYKRDLRNCQVSFNNL